MLFSFYYTEKIEEIEEKYKEVATNAIIDGEYIVPGVMGRMVNKTKSFVNMKSFGVFNEYYLIFDNVKPDISLEDNKDKIIKSGHPSKKEIAYLLEEGNQAVEQYFEENKIVASLLVTEETYKNPSSFEQINNDQKKCGKFVE